MVTKRIGSTDYYISNTGVVFSDKQVKRRRLKPAKDKNGYLYVVLMVDGKRLTKKVHRLVANAFIDGDRTLQVHHKDENKENNHFENLEWVTAKENSNYSNSKKVAQYTKDGVLVRIWNSATEADEVGGFCRENVSRCALEVPKHKSHKGFIWRFYE